MRRAGTRAVRKTKSMSGPGGPWSGKRLTQQRLRVAPQLTHDIDRMQAWSGQSARLAQAKPAGDLVHELWSGAQALLR